jgi:hypothetical protein
MDNDFGAEPWIVIENTASRSTKDAEELALQFCGRSRYAKDWLVVQALNASDALYQAGQFEAGSHPQQRELELFAVAYWCGGVQLPRVMSLPRRKAPMLARLKASCSG